MSKEPIVYQFTPRFPGEYLIGAPSRDLTAADVAKLDPERRVAIDIPDANGKRLYTPVRPAPREDKAKEDKAKEPKLPPNG